MSDPQSVKIESKAAPATPGAPAGAAPGGAGAPAGGGSPAARPAPKPAGPGRVKRTARQIKQVLLVVVGALIAAFAISNRDDVRVRWIFGDPVSTPLILVIAIALVAGLVLGWLIAKLSGRHSD